MNHKGDNQDYPISILTETDDFIVRLEKAAELFLSLLQMSKYFKVQLSSISVVCEVALFIQSHSDIDSVGSLCVKEEAAQTQLTNQTSTLHKKERQMSEHKVESDIALTVKRRRAQMKRQTKNVQTKRSIIRKRKSCTKSSNTNCNKKLKQHNNAAEVDIDNKKNEDSFTIKYSNEQSYTENHMEDDDNSDLRLLSQPDQLSDFQCSYCNKVFIDRRNLKSHLWVHERDKTFQCEVCKKLFLRSHQLTRHRRVHTGEKPYPCAVCDKAFADVSNLNTHKRKEHPNHVTLLLRCEQCGKECQSKKDLQVHLAVHEKEDTKDKLWEDIVNLQDGSVQSREPLHLHRAKSKLNAVTFLCQICGKGLNKRAALLAHMKRHIRKKDFRCEFCNKVFPELRELKIHRREHSGDRPYKCDKCGKGFKSQGTLRSHLGVHSGDQPYSCDVCRRTFSQTSGLNQHKLKHTAEEERAFGSSKTDSQQHNCGICGRCYKTKFRLQLHFRSHDSKRDVSCDFCDKKFQTAQDLAIHRRSHTKDKYSCRVCGASFKSRSVYYFHTRTHQIDRPYLCSTCGKSFISANDLNAHKRRHTVGNLLIKPHEQFICNVCGKIYQMKNSLFIHMKIHQGIFDHPCDFCEKKFKSHAELRHHRRVHTLEKPYVCETCNRQFSRHSTLVNHRRTHSGERPYMCTICGAAFKLSCTLKKHAKIHTRETRGGKGRPHSEQSKIQGQKTALLPCMQEHQQIHQQELLHDNQLQQQLSPHSSLSQCVPTSISSAVPQNIQKVTPLLVDDSEETNFIHELKPVTTSIMHIHNQSNILDPQNSTTSMIQQSNRDDEPNRMDHRQTAKI